MARQVGLGLALFIGLAAPLPALAQGPSGFDVSFPNCGQPLPSTRPEVAIVGVEGGRSFTSNPCLAEEFRWANETGHHFEAYINTSFPAGSAIHRGDTGPKGACAAEDWACKAYNYGFNNAEFAVHYAQTQFAMADTWWLDVETENSWSDITTWNDQAIQGAVDSLQSHDLYVGVYSIPSMWKEIAGDYVVKVPKWVVRLHASLSTDAYCAAEHGFGGGTIALVQFGYDPFDQDLSCPVQAFADQPTFVALPLTSPQTGQLFGRHGGVSVFYTLPAARAGALQAVTFNFWPYGADVANALFVTVNQGNRQLANARGTDTPTPGRLSVVFTAPTADPLVVRIQGYNFEVLPPVSYYLAPS